MSGFFVGEALGLSYGKGSFFPIGKITDNFVIISFGKFRCKNIERRNPDEIYKSIRLEGKFKIIKGRFAGKNPENASFISLFSTVYFIR